MRGLEQVRMMALGKGCGCLRISCLGFASVRAICLGGYGDGPVQHRTPVFEVVLSVHHSFERAVERYCSTQAELLNEWARNAIL